MCETVNVSVFDIHLRRILWVFCPGHAGVKENDREDKTGGQCNHHRQLASQKILSVEELETLPVDTKPKTSHHRSPWEERRRKRKRSTIFLERTRKGHHRQWDQHWNCFKGNIGEMGWSAYGLSWVHRYHLELNWTEQNRTEHCHWTCFHLSHLCSSEAWLRAFTPVCLVWWWRDLYRWAGVCHSVAATPQVFGR